MLTNSLHSVNHVCPIRSIFGAVDEDTIVFVFGDHGMTVTGDHGGETELETTAALLVYTPTPLFPPMQVSTSATLAFEVNIETIFLSKVSGNYHCNESWTHHLVS